MKIITYKIWNAGIMRVGIWLCCMGLMTSCKQDFGRLLTDTRGESDSLDIVYGTPKVLLLIADGARGESVRTAEIPNMNSLLSHAIYSWVSLSDEDAIGTATDLADIVTGVGAGKHQVVNNNYSSNNLNVYPLLFTRIAEAKKEANFFTYSSSSDFINYLAPKENSEFRNSDQGVTDGIIEGLAKDEVTLITGHFTEINEAGANGGYDHINPAYQQAIQVFDGQVGEVMKALRKRKNFKSENWLVIIASSKGGPFTLPENLNDNTIFSNTMVNTFTIMYAPKYFPRYVNKPFMGSRFTGDFLRFNGNKYAELVDGDNAVFNIDDKTDFTIELKVKKNRGVNNTYKFPDQPSFFGKRNTWENGAPGMGWTLFFKDNYWSFNGRGTTGTGEVEGTRLNDATWNTLTVVGYLDIASKKRYIRTYTNGTLSKEIDVTAWGSMSNATRLRLGTLPLGGSNWTQADYYISDVRFWKTALSEELVKKYSCDIGVTPDHPYYEYLAANWLVFGAANDQPLRDDGPLGYDLSLNTSFTITKLSDYLCSPSNASLRSLVPKNTDLAAQIYSWLQIPRQESWQLDGRVWVDR